MICEIECGGGEKKKTDWPVRLFTQLEVERGEDRAPLLLFLLGPDGNRKYLSREKGEGGREEKKESQIHPPLIRFDSGGKKEEEKGSPDSFVPFIG